MSQFRSLPSFQCSDDTDVVEEHYSSYSDYSDFVPASSPTTTPLVGTYATQYPSIHTGQLEPISRPLHDISSIPSTNSLANALQSTMTPSRTTGQLVYIPGNKKWKQATSGTRPRRRMRRRVRHGLALGTIVLVLVTTMLSLVPLDNGQSSFHLFGGVIQWVNAQQQNWNIAAHTTATTQNNPVVSTTSNGSTSANVASSDAGNLPINQYVALARQDAMSAGISPDYFERQIFQESSFNPGAVSPMWAVGIAQFLPSTAAGLGVDPYDPVSALQGAAKLMASYANQYNGDYAKALAAYNAGSGTLQYAVNACGSGWLNCMPAETQHYVAVIMGI